MAITIIIFNTSAKNRNFKLSMLQKSVIFSNLINSLNLKTCIQKLLIIVQLSKICTQYTFIRMVKPPKRLTKADLNLPCKEMALYLLGKILVRKLENGPVLKGRIVEVECYLGGDDKASNSYNGRQTAANEPLYMPAGTAFVYLTYGMYHCFNISSIEPGAAVLLRALEPVQGIESMKKFRAAKKKGSLKDTELCNGPSKLCMAMSITKSACNKANLCDSEHLWLEDDGERVENGEIVATSRIGIDSAGKEWASKPLRFYISSNLNVSKRDKKAEV